MEAKERILPDWKLIDIAETLYNFRNAMDIEGIKNTLWQLAKQQDNVSLKAGIKEVVEWVLSESDYDCGHFIFDIDQEIWNSKLKEWGIKED